MEKETFLHKQGLGQHYFTNKGINPLKPLTLINHESKGIYYIFTLVYSYFTGFLSDLLRAMHSFAL